jgi:hypothetical protein
MVTSSIGGDKLMETKPRNRRVESESLGNGVEDEEEEVCGCVRTGEKMMGDHIDSFKYNG